MYNPLKGALDFSGNGAGCNTLEGDLAVDQLSYDASGLASVTRRFIQHCEVTGRPLHGALRWVRPAS